MLNDWWWKAKYTFIFIWDRKSEQWYYEKNLSELLTLLKKSSYKPEISSILTMLNSCLVGSKRNTVDYVKTEIIHSLEWTHSINLIFAETCFICSLLLPFIVDRNIWIRWIIRFSVSGEAEYLEKWFPAQVCYPFS